MSDSDEDSRKRAKDSLKTMVRASLETLLPGAGTALVRLGDHLAGAVRDERIRRLDRFHAQVFTGEALTDEEINDRSRSMEDGDLANLLAHMLQDVEGKKVELYSAVYVYLVENSGRLSASDKLDLAQAVVTLRMADLRVLAAAVREGERVSPSSRSNAYRKALDGVPTACVQRLILVGALTPREGTKAPGPTGLGFKVASEFGSLID